MVKTVDGPGKADADDRSAQAPSAAEPREPERPPESAEDFGHVLRRLTVLRTARARAG